MDDLGVTPTLERAVFAELTKLGSDRAAPAGEVITSSGDRTGDFIVVVSGSIDVIAVDEGRESVIATVTAGGFLGELDLVTGQAAILTARASVDSLVSVIPRERFAALLAARPAVASLLIPTFLRRRELLRSGAAARQLRIVGSTHSVEARTLREFAIRARIPHTWVDLDTDPGAAELLGRQGLTVGDTPTVVTNGRVLRRAAPADLAQLLGLGLRPHPDFTFDVVIVGCGPAGLAAAVYAASEGLRTIAVDGVATGGQAATSSRIENYLGFPTGISGDELATLAAVQARRLGAELVIPLSVVGLRTHPTFHVVVLADGSEIPARTVVIATGARYRRLAVNGLATYEQSGVYYAATEHEMRACEGLDVTVVGGGNSAGQAAVFLADAGCRVSIAVRRDNLEATMSRYLIDRIADHPSITVLTSTEISALHGDGRLEAVSVRSAVTGVTRCLPCAGLFSFIGATPESAWAAGAVALDTHGFVLTGRDAPTPAARPALAYESSVPGVFAVGDVRHGSPKRVATAVGEGSGVVRSIHEHLAGWL